MRVHVSNKSEKNVITLGLYENHFVYINDINMICKVFDVINVRNRLLEIIS